MNVKNRVLEILEKRIGENISGEEMAKTLGISRNSVWKAIKALKDDGYDISAQTKNGYVLSCENDLFTAHSINKLLNKKCNVIIYDERDSSNNVAKELAQNGEKDGTLVVVKRQTKGKGRMGRSFISNEENGLYMSLILRPTISASESLDITIIGAVAVAEAIEKLAQIPCGIKWVNDVFIGEKKVCGILTEASLSFETSSLDYVVLGIGVNIIPPPQGFDREIENIACAILEKNEIGFKSRLCAEIINRFYFYYDNIKERSFINVYKTKSNIIGKNVDVFRGSEIISGKCTDIDDFGNLVVESNGETMRFSSGEARVRKNEQ